MYQVKFVEDKFYLVHSWMPWCIWYITKDGLNDCLKSQLIAKSTLIVLLNWDIEQ